MKKVHAIVNIAIAITGIELTHRMLITYDNPIIIGSVWVSLIGIKCILDTFNKR